MRSMELKESKRICLISVEVAATFIIGVFVQAMDLTMDVANAGLTTAPLFATWLQLWIQIMDMYKKILFGYYICTQV